jgi:plasmid stabilization system protein ParE
VLKVIVSPRARGDLLQIIDYIRQDNQRAAERFGNAILDHVEILGSFPQLGAAVDRKPGVRSLLHTPVRIYYRVNEKRKRIEILHFWHAARREPKS